MEFITVEQFKVQPKEVQEVFLDWWKANISEFDLIGYIGRSEAYKECFPSLVRNVAMNCFEIGIEIIPLFTEGQLRKFIEDKFRCKNIELIANVDTCQYEIYLYRKISSLSYQRHIDGLGDNILQAYWKVSCMIAMEELA